MMFCFQFGFRDHLNIHVFASTFRTYHLFFLLSKFKTAKWNHRLKDGSILNPEKWEFNKKPWKSAYCTNCPRLACRFSLVPFCAMV
jgi:hypothetical protein